MSDSSYFLVPASSGLCIEQRSNGIFTDSVEGKSIQQWYLESGDNNKIAFRNASSGAYLRALGGNKAAKVATGKKQFWTLEKSNTPSAFWIKCDEFPNAYLCNSYGAYTKNNLIYVWAHEINYTQTMLWRIEDYGSWKDAKASGPADLLARATASSKQSSTDVARKQDDLEARERKVEEREQKLKEQEEALATREKKVAETRTEPKDEVKPGQDKGSDRGEESVKATKQIHDLQNQLSDTKSKLEASERAQADLKARIQELADREQGIALAYAQSQGDGQDRSIAARRVQPEGKELEAASVGLRKEPLGFRTNIQPTSTRRGQAAPIALQQTFSHLPRLRS